MPRQGDAIAHIRVTVDVMISTMTLQVPTFSQQPTPDPSSLHFHYANITYLIRARPPDKSHISHPHRDAIPPQHLRYNPQFLQPRHQIFLRKQESTRLSSLRAAISPMTRIPMHGINTPRRLSCAGGNGYNWGVRLLQTIRRAAGIRAVHSDGYGAGEPLFA